MHLTTRRGFAALIAAAAATALGIGAAPAQVLIQERIMPAQARATTGCRGIGGGTVVGSGSEATTSPASSRPCQR